MGGALMEVDGGYKVGVGFVQRGRGLEPNESPSAKGGSETIHKHLDKKHENTFCGKKNCPCFAPGFFFPVRGGPTHPFFVRTPLGTQGKGKDSKINQHGTTFATTVRRKADLQHEVR